MVNFFLIPPESYPFGLTWGLSFAALMILRFTRMGCDSICLDFSEEELMFQEMRCWDKTILCYKTTYPNLQDIMLLPLIMEVWFNGRMNWTGLPGEGRDKQLVDSFYTDEDNFTTLLQNVVERLFCLLVVPLQWSNGTGWECTPTPARHSMVDTSTLIRTSPRASSTSLESSMDGY